MGRRVSHVRTSQRSSQSIRWLSLGVMALALSSHARAEPARWSLRIAPAAAMMVSDSQVGPLYFDKPGTTGSVRTAYAVRPWLELDAALHAGWFFASRRGSGGLLALAVGPALRLPGRVSPYLALDFGAGVTGAYVRPFLALNTGVDFFAVRERIAAGPAFGYGRLMQWNKPELSSDAGYVWLGASLRVQFGERPPPPSPPRRMSPRRPAPPPPPPPPEPTPDVVELIERALPQTPRVELLAPVLFAFDSDELEPVGVAMLHEVASMLRARPDLELVQIQGFADERGSAEYNQALSRRRAERVRAWLVEHDVAAERLTTDPQGATGFVEAGTDEAGHAQNRRVIFRVLRVAEP